MSLLLLALEAALYPTLLAAVVILLALERPAVLLAAYLAGGLVISIGLGLLIVLVLGGSIDSQSSGLSYGADLTVGGLALVLAVVLATNADTRLRERRRRRRPSPVPDPDAVAREPWSQRILARGSLPIVFLAAMAVNVPGAAYLIALKDIAAGNHPTGIDVLLIVAFNLIMFLLAEVPLAGLLIAPERTASLVADMDGWLSSHGRQIAVVLCAILGLFLIARGIANA